LHDFHWLARNNLLHYPSEFVSDLNDWLRLRFEGISSFSLFFSVHSRCLELDLCPYFLEVTVRVFGWTFIVGQRVNVVTTVVVIVAHSCLGFYFDLSLPAPFHVAVEGWYISLNFIVDRGVSNRVVQTDFVTSRIKTTIQVKFLFVFFDFHLLNAKLPFATLTRSLLFGNFNLVFYAGNCELMQLAVEPQILGISSNGVCSRSFHKAERISLDSRCERLR